MSRSAASRSSGSWLLVAVLGFAGTTVSFMQTLVIPIQNHLPELVDAPRSATAWVITISLLASAVTTPISGRLGDIFGKRKIALAMLVLLIAGSLIAALSTGLTWLLVGRALQGASMGVVAVGIAILGDHPEPKQRIMGIAYMSASLGFGGAVGLPISGWIVMVGDWKMLFWFSFGLGVLNIVLLWAVVPRSAGTGQRLDLVGAAGLAVGLSGILIAISQGPSWGWYSPATLASFVGGVLLLVAWGAYELRVRDPIVDLRVLARRPLLFVNLGTIAIGFSFFVSQVSFLQILELPGTSNAGLGLTMLTASLALMPGALTMVVAAPISARLTSKFGGRVTTTSGALIVALAYALTVVWHSDVWHIVAWSMLLYLGLGISYSAIPTLVMAEVSRDATGSANGVNALMRSVGTSTGAAITGMVLAATSVSVNGQEIPEPVGFVTVFVLGMVGALVSAGLVWLSQRRATS